MCDKINASQGVTLTHFMSPRQTRLIWQEIMPTQSRIVFLGQVNIAEDPANSKKII